MKPATIVMRSYLEGQQVDGSEAHMFIVRLFKRALVLFARVLGTTLARRSNETKLHAVIQRDGDWYVGWIEEIPGANTQGETLEELRENLIEAALLIIESNRDDARRAAKGHDVRRETLTVAV
jgi:predicted RNase H-like HicB family nuclease